MFFSHSINSTATLEGVSQCSMNIQYLQYQVSSITVLHAYTLDFEQHIQVQADLITSRIHIIRRQIDSLHTDSLENAVVRT